MTDAERDLARVLLALRLNANESMRVRVHGVELELGSADARPVRAALRRVLLSMQREAQRSAA